MVDDDAWQPGEQVGMADADLADPLQGAAVGDDDEVVGRGRVRIGPKAGDTLDVVVERWHRVGAHGIGGAAERLDDPDDPERRPQRVGVGVFVADGQHPPGAAKAVDDGRGNVPEIRTQIDGHRCGRDREEGLRVPVRGPGRRR